MLNNTDYIKLSLELHLFFARIMKEHSYFLEAGFVGKDNKYKEVANQFQSSFAEILNKVIELSDGNISNDVLMSQEIITPNTLASENKTSDLLGLYIDDTITRKEMNLKSGITKENAFLVNAVDDINRKVLQLVENLIKFKNDVLNRVLECKMFTGNYPLLISHIINEAKMYHKITYKLLNRELETDKEVYEQEIFWNTIMKEHAEFIRGLLDPSEKELFATSNTFANEYEYILQNYSSNPMNLTNVSLQETTHFRDFKEAGEKGILACKIKSIIIPLLADHVLREANHFIRILSRYNRSSNYYF